MSVFTSEDVRQARAVLALFRAMEARRLEHPDECYAPSYPGLVKPDGEVCGAYANQLGFHKARHPIRLLAPGNGWGKTTAAGAEANAWATHHQLWRPTPAWPVHMVWFCKAYDQFELIRFQLQETVFTREARWVDGGFRWPDGSTLAIGSAGDSTTWKRWQGTPPDLVIFDEQPPRQLWREMRMRRRATRKTEYVFAMTATEGESWVEEELFRPWVDHHQSLGIDEEKALWVQSHPTTYVWHRGGIGDNPGADHQDVDWYESSVWSSEKERQVRLRGGFQRWVGDAIFDEEAMAAMEEEALALDQERGEGKLGWFTFPFDLPDPEKPRYPKWQKPKFGR